VGVRTWLLRRAAGRLRITDDIIGHLSTLQRLGETVEVQVPGELLPVGARTVFRAVRTRAVAQLGDGWVLPYWMERQLDPRSAAFVPRGHLPALTNMTSRNWTAVGTVASSWRAIVDPRGLVTPWFDGWSLDWWIGADDRWHFPSREAAVRQSLVAHTPVVETAMRIPSGDAVERVYAVRGDEELAVVEVTNRSPVPIAVAFAVRPVNPEGFAVVERIALHDRTVTVDGRPALLLPRRPAVMAGGTYADGDSAQLIVEGRAGDRLPSPLRCDVGLAQAVFVYPLPHTATLRVALPLVSERRTRRRALARRRVERLPQLPVSLPSSDDAARGWLAQSGRGMRLELPEGRLADTVAANRRLLRLFHTGPEVHPGPYTYNRFWFRDAAYLLRALDWYGYHDEAAEVIRTYPERQHLDGFFFSQRQEWDANGCALWAIAEHWRLTRDTALLDALAPSVDRAARWIERKRHSPRRRKDPALTGLLPAGTSAEHLGPFDYYFWDSFWGLRGLIDGAALLTAAGQPDKAAQARVWAAGMAADLDRSLALVAERLGSPAIPAGPRRRVDPAAIGSLVACHPLGLLGATSPAISATAEAIRSRFCIEEAFFQGISHTGLGTYLTLQLALVELEAGDRRALDRLEWMARVASPTACWPEAIHPQLGGGCMGDGQHGWAAADFLAMVRNLLVREAAPSCTTTAAAARAAPAPGLVLCSLLPAAWLGHGIEVHDAPTAHGRLSFAVRWHAERPALLWELHGWDGAAPVRLTAPGLDPSWSAEVPRGEALLSPVQAGSFA
jgi:hypothetical protein